MMCRNAIIPITVGLLMYLDTSAQSVADSTTWTLGLQGHYGFIIPHSRELIDVSQTHPRGIQVDWSRIRHTTKAWNACNCYSRNGIILGYFDFNNPQVLGRSFSASLFAEPVLTHGKVNLSLRTGFGITYLTNVYHAEENPSNLFFSSPISGLLMVQLNGRFPITESWTIRAGASYHHISNGGFRKPNKGMNFPMMGMGIERVFNPMPFQVRSKSNAFSKSVHFYTGLFTNTRSVEVLGAETGQRKLMVGMQVGAYRRFTHLNAVGLATEFSYDNSIRLSTPAYNPGVFSTLMRHHLLFGKFDFSQALGIYLYRDYPSDHRVFQRYAIDYAIMHPFRIGFSLKAHRHIAEQMDIRITAHF